MNKVIVFLTGSIIGLIAYITVDVMANYQYDAMIQSHWDLADKASTITKKIDGVDKFVFALSKSGLDGKYDAIFMKTPNNGFNENYEALKSLQTRLHDIEKMDVKSFEYQTAMQQLTGQEMGEAQEMIKVFRNIWYKENYFLWWDWVSAIGYISFIVVIIICFMKIGDDFL